MDGGGGGVADGDSVELTKPWRYTPALYIHSQISYIDNNTTSLTLAPPLLFAGLQSLPLHKPHPPVLANTPHPLLPPPLHLPLFSTLFHTLPLTPLFFLAFFLVSISINYLPLTVIYHLLIFILHSSSSSSYKATLQLQTF